MTAVWIALLRLLSWLPLPLLRALGAGLGWLMYAVAHKRRRIASINVRLCLPTLTEAEHRALLRRHFVVVMQSFLDRSWLWLGSERLMRQRLHIEGDLDVLHSPAGAVIFAPHFVGVDAGGLRLPLVQRAVFSFIYMPQNNPEWDSWINARRERFGGIRGYLRGTGAKQILAGLRQGEKLHLSSDMDLGPRDSFFVPFFGIPTATVPSISRFSRLARVPVYALITRMTESGYHSRMEKLSPDVPTDDAERDTAWLNERLQEWILTMPEQYYWVHKRFKTRPAGQASVY